MSPGRAPAHECSIDQDTQLEADDEPIAATILNSMAGEIGSTADLSALHLDPRVIGDLGPSPADDPTRFDVVGYQVRYSRSELLSTGGMGDVHEIRDSWIGRDVAAKFLRRNHQTNPRARAMFLREAVLQGRLEHPSIVPVHDVGIAPDGRPFFIMKRVRGLNLREVLEGLRRGDPQLTAKFTRRKLLAAFSNVCLTLAFAHEQDVVHRDVKPSNIMLGDFGETYLLDWGLAKALHPLEYAPKGDALLDSENTASGTPGYMAPEQARGSAEAVSPAIDIYALGCLLFEILTFHPLHRGSTKMDLVQSCLREVDARASVLYPAREVPPELEAICIKATAFASRDRYVSVRALHDDLERYLDGERDLTLRRDLARVQVQAASAAESAARDAAPESEEAHRGAAIQSLGVALALDRDNRATMQRLVDLLLEPARALPKEVAAAAQGTLVKYHATAGKAVAVATLWILLGLPLIGMMGVRNIPLFSAIVLGTAACFMLQIWSLRSSPPRWVVPLMITLVVGANIVASRLFGPLFYAVNILVMYAGTIASAPSARVRVFGLCACLFGVLAPTALEHLGVFPPSYRFTDGGMTILPQLISLPPFMSEFMVNIFNATFTLLQFFGVVYALQVLRRSEERSQLYAWRLRQLVPSVPLSPGEV